jgi:hypothetical protein
MILTTSLVLAIVVVWVLYECVTQYLCQSKLWYGFCTRDLSVHSMKRRPMLLHRFCCIGSMADSYGSIHKQSACLKHARMMCDNMARSVHNTGV